MPTTVIDGLAIRYEDEGAGVPVVLVHGSWTDLRGWDALVPELAGHARVVRHDRRGHSRSERPPGQGTTDQDVSDLAALIASVVGEPAHVVGSSFGATIALRLGIARPDLVLSLALHEPPLWGLAPGAPGVRALRATVDAVVGRLETGDDEGGARLFAERILGPGAWETGMPEQLKATLVANAPTFLDETRDPGAYELPARDGLGQLGPRTLVSTGECGDPAFAVIADRLADALPGVERVTLAGAGHVPHRTHPAELAAALDACGARVPPPRPVAPAAR
jgi:pimeloyl-ACP methyl ester carboxylesterase